MRNPSSSSSNSHIGIAFYHTHGHPIHCVLVVSKSALFDEGVWCSTIMETVNGWDVSWTMCDRSPTSYSRTAFLLGIVHVAQVYASVTDLKNMINSCNPVSELDRFGVHGSNDLSFSGDKYVTLAILRLSEMRVINLPVKEPKSLFNAIRQRIPQPGNAMHSLSANEIPVTFLFQGDHCIGRGARCY